MKKTLIPKLIFGYVLFVVLGFIILCTFTQHAITHYAENREAQQLYRESVQIASGYADNYNKYSFSLQDFQKQMQSLGEYLSAQIWIMDNQGNILFDSTDESVGKDAANANYKTLKGFNTSDFGNRYYMTGNFYGSFSEKKLTVFSPITSNYRIHSYVMIHKTVSSITQNANGFMNIVFYTIEFVFLTALFLLLLFAHGFYRPLHRLTIVSESYAKGNFEPRTQIHRNDELGYLANTMDYMANELDTLEEDQRKFISNVSHDFRSPLTSIKGYIEAMLDGTIPPELQNKYLNIILFETERLTKLTQGILDLNRFGQHRGMMLDLTDFDINRMIKTTIHAGINRRAVEALKRQKRTTNIVSRGGSLLFAWMEMTGNENPFYEYYDDVLDILRKYDVTISLGDALRPGCNADSTDAGQISELVELGALTKRAWERDVQVMVEGPGHMTMDEIAANMKLQKRLCYGAPFYVLGPLVTDVAPGYDHITAAIGGAIAAMSGADFLCYVTPAEHLRLPDLQDVRDGIVASKIAAHAADLARGIPGARDWDNAMSKARCAIDWEGMFAQAIDPEKARNYFESRPPQDRHTCSMCGKMCAMRTSNKILNGESVSLAPDEK